MFFEAAHFWPRLLLAQVHFFGHFRDIHDNSVVTGLKLNIQIYDVLNALQGLNNISKWRQCFSGLKGTTLFYIAVKTQVSVTSS